MSVPARRRQVAYACKRGVSQRRACTLLSVARSSLGYESRLAEKDAAALEAMRELAGQYPRYGYRRIQVLLRRLGFEMSAERTYRLWRQAELQVPRRRPRRRIASGRPRPTPATATATPAAPGPRKIPDTPGPPRGATRATGTGEDGRAHRGSGKPTESPRDDP